MLTKKGKAADFKKPVFKFQQKNVRAEGKQGVCKKSKLQIFSIRNKIIVCFLVPIAFMAAVGVYAYQMASSGMSDKFKASTLQTMEMATEYVDMATSFIESEAFKYAHDAEMGRYYLGLYESDKQARNTLLQSTNSDMLTAQASNKFISNIHIVTNPGVQMLSTKTGIKNRTEGFLDIYKDDIMQDSEDGSTSPRWIDRHKLLDESAALDEEEYILAYQMFSPAGNAAIVIDLKPSAIREFLSGLDLGEGSMVAFVTESGREILCENQKENEESILAGGEISMAQLAAQHTGSGQQSGSADVVVSDRDYLFIFSRSQINGVTVCALVPSDIVTGQAEEIRAMTVRMVILAGVIAGIIGISVTLGIQVNLKRISGKLGEVAKGDLTVQVRVKGRDEFRQLASSVADMISKNKKLVGKAGKSAEHLESSANDVKEVSGVIRDYTAHITEAMNEITAGMERQSRHAQKCVIKTDLLSDEMKGVNEVAQKVGGLVAETDEMIGRGMEIIRVLGERAKETNLITAEVGKSVEDLKKEIEQINDFVETITDITSQTNLLSLNASIEAARAGEAGRGFSVVAEEIRKLADSSAQAAGEISHNVESIIMQTRSSAERAREAESMVALQTEAVEEVICVFREMNQRMTRLVEGLHEIVSNTEKADGDRAEALAAVRNISEIIEDTARSTEVVSNAADKLLRKVENLNQTAEALGQNMDELKSEISVFKTE